MRRKGLMIEMDLDEFRRNFPHLASEILDEKGIKMKVYFKKAKKQSDPWRGYNPTVIDFIRRARCEEEALEVIDFMEKRGEISKEYAESLRKQLKEKGLKSFGSFKEPGYYFKKAGIV